MFSLNNQIFAVWKPKGPSSNAVLNIIRRAAGTKHVGHAGTLDPLAEGILVVGVGREATKKLATEVAKEKEYEAEITLGATSETDDSEGPIRPYDAHCRDLTECHRETEGRGDHSERLPRSLWSLAMTQDGNMSPDVTEIHKVLEKFVGEIDQLPPAYSALKIGGQRAYRLARKGEAPKMEARKVLIKSIEFLSYTWPILRIRVTTGPGVYIRSLARDIGEALGTGAYMSGLVRTRVGEYTKEKIIRLEDMD